MPGTQRPARMRARPCAPGRDCWHRTAPHRRRCRAPPGPAAMRSAGAPGGNAPRCLQQPAQRRAHVEGHADAGQRAAGKAVAGHVRIDDDVGLRQLGSGQVMIGDQHIDAARARRGHAGVAGDAVVDRDDQRRRAFGGDGDDLRASVRSRTRSGWAPGNRPRQSPSRAAPAPSAPCWWHRRHRNRR